MPFWLPASLMGSTPDLRAKASLSLLFFIPVIQCYWFSISVNIQCLPHKFHLDPIFGKPFPTTAYSMIILLCLRQNIKVFSPSVLQPSWTIFVILFSSICPFLSVQKMVSPCTLVEWINKYLISFSQVSCVRVSFWQQRESKLLLQFLPSLFHLPLAEMLS